MLYCQVGPISCFAIDLCASLLDVRSFRSYDRIYTKMASVISLVNTGIRYTPTMGSSHQICDWGLCAS